jgi:hypothetical protein
VRNGLVLLLLGAIEPTPGPYSVSVVNANGTSNEGSIQVVAK